jgi:uncharacterized protein (DUF2235 family)
MRGRNLCFFLDGTNAFAGGASGPSTNVYKLSCMLDDKSKSLRDQIIFYFPGTGSESPSYLKGSTLFGNFVEHICRQVYVSIATNYRDGDRIYLFGWSRGAASCRILASIISNYGLIKPHAIENLHTIWNMIANADLKEIPRDESKFVYPDISGLSLFDTVAFWSDKYFINKVLGTRNTRKFSANSLIVESHVGFAFHIASIDEQNPLFPLIPFTGVKEYKTKLLQIFTPGGHGDIGGSKSTLSSYISLMTMKSLLSKYSDLKFLSKVHSQLEWSELNKFMSVKRNFSTFGDWQNSRRRLRDYDFESLQSFDYIHPIVKKITGRPVKNINKCLKYNFKYIMKRQN